MKKIIFYLSFIGIYNAHAQELNPVFDDTIFDGNRLIISSFNYYASNFATNELMDKFIFGGEITTDMKDRVSNKLGRNNSIGGEVEQKFEHFNADLLPFKKDKFGLIISLSDNHLISGNVSKDLFNTVFYGNANALNDTLDFGFSHVLYQHYLKLGVGIYNKSTLSSLTLNYVSGSRGFEGRLNDTWMYNTVDSISFMLQGAGFRTDSSKGYWGFQGSGIALDLNYNFQFDSRNGYNQMVNLKISNIGIMAWNTNTYHYAVDSLNNYQGFNVHDFINRGDADAKVYNFNDTLGITSRQGKQIGALPIEFSLQKVPLRHSLQKLQYLAGFKTILTADYFPYLYGGLYYMPNPYFAASTRVSYGGFGGFQWGLNLNLWLKNKVYFGLGSFDLIGLASKKYGFGRSINFSANFNL
jgi:hypothetical protein